MSIVIVYGSMTGTTEDVAKQIGSAFDAAAVVSAADADGTTFDGCEFLILGASTWGMGDLQDDMAAFLVEFGSMNVSIKSGAVFGLGDQSCYADTYVNGMADMAGAIKAKGIKLLGATSAAGYDHADSLAQTGDQFVGLALDEDNQSDQTAGRIDAWVRQLKAELEA